MNTSMRMNIMAAILAVSNLTAGTLTWDNDPITVGIQDGAGTWDTTNTNWWDGISNTNWVSSSSAVIGSGGTGGTITLSGTHTVSNMTFGSAYTLSNGTITLAAANTIVTNDVDVHIASILAGSSKGILKKGSGTLYLEGSNTYSGSTWIDQGMVTFAQNYSTTVGGLTFGGTAGSANYGNLDLSSASATFTSLTIRNSNTVPNTVTIGSNQTLTVNGNVTMYKGASGTVISTLNMAGAGQFSVNKSGATFSVGNDPGANVSANYTNDMSALATAVINLGSTGIMNIQLAGGNMPSGNQVLKLATNTTITAGTLSVGSAPGGAGFLLLGSGVNTLNVNTIYVGDHTGGRASGILTYKPSSDGTLAIRAADGTSGAWLNVLATSNAGTGSGMNNTFDVSGHSADLKFSTVDMTNVSVPGAAYNSSFSFDTGTLTASTFKIGTRTGGASTLTQSATVRIGTDTGNYLNTADLGAVTVAVNQASAGSMVGSLIIAGTNTSVSMSSLLIASTTNTGATANGTVTVSRATLTMNGDILRGSTVGTSRAYFSLSNATLRAGANFTVASDLTMTLPGNVTLDSSTNTMTIAGTIGGKGSLSKIGDGGLLIYGAKTNANALNVSAGYLGGTNIWAGTVTNLAMITAADTNTIGSLTVSNLVLATDSTLLWNYDNTNADVIHVTGTLTLPDVATVQVSRVSGKLPPLATLATYNSLAGSSNLQNWKVVGDSVQPRTYVRLNNNEVQLVSPAGTMISIF